MRSVCRRRWNYWRKFLAFSESCPCPNDSAPAAPAAAEGAPSSQRPPQQRQQKKYPAPSGPRTSDSRSSTQPPAAPAAAAAEGEACQISMDFSYAEVGTEGFHRAQKSPAGRLFLFWTVNGPFSLFLREEKEKMGGSTHPPAMGMAAKEVPSLLVRWRGGGIRRGGSFLCRLHGCRRW